MLKILSSLAVLIFSSTVVGETLFESDETLALTFTVPFNKINRSRDKTKHYEAQLFWGESMEIPVTLQARGNNRLDKDICTYPPLRVHFEKGTVKNTVFENQSNLKIVLACKKKYSQYVRLEFLAYKMYALISDNYFKVRWLELTFIDDQRTFNSPGFFIEQKKRMGARLGLTQVHKNRILPSALDQRAAATTNLFQFMIGNTDYSSIWGAGQKDCCHNTKLMEQTDKSGPYIPIPYDFDSSGIINARYAIPEPALKIRSVRVRKYRGWCSSNPYIPVSLGLIQARKEEILSLFADDTQLTNRKKSSAVKYLQKFYKIIDTPKNLNRSIIEVCRGKTL